MKRNFYALSALFLVVSAGLFVSCGSKSTPTTPAGPPTSTFTPTISPTPISVRWGQATINKTNDNGSISQYAQLYLSVGGQAVSTDPVYISSSALTNPVTLPYSSTVTQTGVPYAVYLLNGTGWSYQPGQSYSLSTQTTAGLASVTVTAPGNIGIAADGSSVTWTNGGTSTYIQVSSGGVTYFTASGTPLSSPLSIPASVYASPGSYSVWVYTDVNINPVPGILSGNFDFREEKYMNITVVAPTSTQTQTPSNTNTPTNTFTPTTTPSGTYTIPPTGTYTKTATPTVTSSPTATATSTITSTPTVTSTVTSTPTNTPTGPHWRFAGGEAAVPGNSGTLALYGSTLYLTYETDAGEDCAFTSWNGSSWATSTVDNNYVSYFSSYFDPTAGVPYFGFADPSNTDFGTMRKYNGSWNYVGPAAFSSGAVYQPSMTVFDNGTTIVPYMVYQDPGNSYYTTVMAYNGTHWVTIGAPDFIYGDMYSLVINSDGTPYMSFRDLANGDDLGVVKFNGTSWVAVGSTVDITSKVAQFTSMSIYNNNLYVAFQDSTFTGGQASVMTYNLSSPSGWNYLGSGGFTGTAAHYLSLYIDSGTPYVAYQDFYDTNSRASVMKYSAGTWSLVGNADFTPGSASLLSLVVKSGVPYLAFDDGVSSSGYDDSVMYYQ
jgi:hypothetical protein